VLEINSKLETVETKYEEAESYAQRRRQAERMAEESAKTAEIAVSKREDVQRAFDSALAMVRVQAEAQGVSTTTGILWMKKDLTLEELLEALYAKLVDDQE